MRIIIIGLPELILKDLKKNDDFSNRFIDIVLSMLAEYNYLER